MFGPRAGVQIRLIAPDRVGELCAQTIEYNRVNCFETLSS